MKRFVLAAVVGSLRWAVAVVIALVALAGATDLVSHRLSNPDHYHALISDGGPGCVYPGPHVLNWGIQQPTCSPPTRAAWQIPLAVLLAAVALGAVLAGADERPRRRSSPELSV